LLENMATTSRLREGSASRLREDELRAWQALLHTHYEVTKILDAEMRAGHAISLDAYDVLLRLARAEHRSLRMTQLADRVLIPPSTLTRRVDRLVEAGLIERSRQPGDARIVVVRLTQGGLALLRRAARTHLQGIHDHFTGKLDLKQLADVAAGLEVVVGPHEEH
jgi:DNA-binding MarR family transcriptional regulator